MVHIRCEKTILSGKEKRLQYIQIFLMRGRPFISRKSIQPQKIQRRIVMYRKQMRKYKEYATVRRKCKGNDRRNENGFTDIPEEL